MQEKEKRVLITLLCLIVSSATLNYAEVIWNLPNWFSMAGLVVLWTIYYYYRVKSSS